MDFYYRITAEYEEPYESRQAVALGAIDVAAQLTPIIRNRRFIDCRIEPISREAYHAAKAIARAARAEDGVETRSGY